MNWQDSDLLLENHNESQNGCTIEVMSSASTNEDENERKTFVQLKKYDDPAKDTHRTSLLNIVEEFLRLMKNNQRQDIDNTLLSHDCLVFVLNFQDNRVKYSSKLGDGLLQVYPDVKIMDLQILERFVDVQKDTVIQISKCLIWHKDETNQQDSLVEKLAYEIFSIRDHKIFKYRVLFGVMTSAHTVDPFVMTTKEKMMARVKELNYALCGLPDIDKFATLLDEDTEYKICGWNQQECLVANKHELKSIFSKLQENMEITKIVPYDFTVSGPKVQANYVYYLCDKKERKRYVWISNCMYLFDEDMKISKILQMGELSSEEEASIPFEVFCTESCLREAKGYVRTKGFSAEIFYGGKASFGCTYCTFGPPSAPTQDTVKLHKYSHNVNWGQTSIDDTDWIKNVDIYLDQYSPSYETGLLVYFEHSKEQVNESGEKIPESDGIRFGKLCFENGKVSKIIHFFMSIHEPIPSLYDDTEFSNANIIPVDKFYRN